MYPSSRSAISAAIAIALIASTEAATASNGVVTVGPFGTAANCTTSDLQAAIELAASDQWDDEIRVTKIGPNFVDGYTQQALSIPRNPAVSPGQSLTIIGGYDSCLPDAQPNGRTRLSGAGGAARSVIEIRGNSEIRLSHFDIVDGDEQAGSNGGGIDVNGSGHLFLNDIQLRDNRAGFGGGLYARGGGGQLQVYLEDDVSIQNNEASRNGGGIYVSGSAKLDWWGSNAVLWFNRATGFDSGNGLSEGYGGGLFISGARAKIDAKGPVLVTPVPVIFANHARFGGGAALNAADGGDARLDLSSPDGATPQILANNAASERGGALYAKPYVDQSGAYSATMCIADVSVRDNIAADGAAIFLDNDDATLVTNRPRAALFFNRPHVDRCSDPPRSCAASSQCSDITRNVAQDVDGNATSGAIIHAKSGNVYGEAWVRGVTVTGNRGGPVVDVDSGESVEFDNILFAANVVAGPVITSDGDSTLLRHITVAGNDIAANQPVLRIREHPEARFQSYLTRSIIWQPSHTDLQPTDDATRFVARHNIGNDPLLPSVSEESLVADPLFANPSAGDFRPGRSSPAVDFAANNNTELRVDLAGNPRNADLPYVTNVFGPSDAGAYEMPFDADVIFSSDFDRVRH